jgi:hypothetical protein
VPQLSILSGIYTDGAPDVRVSYPVNMVPTATENGVSAGYLRPADGLVANGTGPGVARGGIEWRGVCYRVMGTKLVSVAVDGAVTEIGDVGEGGTVSFTYGFDRLAIASDGRLFYWDETTLTEVTDPDVGTVLDVVWIDGYYMVTDGEFLAVSDLTDPTSFNPLKYGSSESDPDPIVAVVRLRNEVYAVNRNGIEVFDNVGGVGFPFQRIEGAKITKGAVGTHAVCVYLESLAFVGSGYNEAPGVYLGTNANASKISTPEIDRVLAGYSEDALATIVVETRNDNGHAHLYIHLPDRCLVFDAAASTALKVPVWFVLVSTLSDTPDIYRARHLVWCYDRWLCADPTSYVVGYLSQDVGTHYGDPVRWEVSTALLFNEGAGAIVNELELVALTGRVALGANPYVSTSWTLDGVNWSADRPILAGKIGDRSRRLRWYRQGSFTRYRAQRFRGTSDAHVSLLRLEAKIEGLAW